MATVKLSWTDNSDNEDGFRIYRSTISNPSFPSDYTEISTVSSNTTAYDDTNAPSGVVHYSVTAFNTAGESSETTNSIETNTPPSIDESSISPTDGATNVSVDPTLSINVSDDDGDDIDVAFIDEADGSQVGTTQTVTGGSGTASVEWSGRDFDQTYSWSVEANDGSATKNSSTFSFTTKGYPLTIDGEEPTELTVDGEVVTGITIDGNTVF